MIVNDSMIVMIGRPAYEHFGMSGSSVCPELGRGVFIVMTIKTDRTGIAVVLLLLRYDRYAEQNGSISQERAIQ